MTSRFITLFMLVLATSKIIVFAFSSNETDHQALLSFKASITDDPLGVLSSWNHTIHFCQWYGVTCSTKRQRVIYIDLYLLQLVGTLSPHIGNLSFLRIISLNKNKFHGSIPNEIGRLSRLQQIYLEYNNIQGEFPGNLSHCVDMRNISMYNNNLRGELPTEFAYWPKLKHLDLGINQFTGSIPPSLGNISHLRHLDLRRNNLVGPIPLEVAHLLKLEVLDLAGNKLLGLLPLQLFNLSSLNVVDLSLNELEGMLPADMSLTLPKMQYFYIGRNRFSGPLPPSVTNASNLVIFDISDNNIIGPVPMNLGSLSIIQDINLAANPLDDSQRPGGLSFFNSLVNCSNLKLLGLGMIGVRGELPISMVNLSTTIEFLDLQANYIYGSIPREIGKLVNITQLSLSDNYLTGTLPESIGELSKLGGLELDYNNISGVIPRSIGNITQLDVLYLENNMLQGSIPSALFNISTLQKLSLANNRLGGAIPEQIVGLSSQCFDLSLARNLFTGPLPSNIGKLKQLVKLSVSENRLTGDIPIGLGDCVMLVELHMEGNLFEGKIPYTFKNLKSLAFLDLSNNNMSGSIPNTFVGFRLITFLNLSHNKFGGEVPTEGLFSNVSAFSVVENSELCGGIQALHLPACPVKLSKYKKKTFSLRIILIVVLVPLGIFLACLALISYRRQNSKKLNDPVPVLKDNQYLKVSYRDLLLATNEFSPINLLGEGRYGSVYKGVLESVEHVVAVKVLNVAVRGASKSFLAECETLSKIRHRNLIKIVTACSSTDFKGNDFKALVFEFMSNGSVDDWLHPIPSYQGKERNLTLLQRLNIVIDVAVGVDYLHHHSHASIIHGDIKPSNVLLDEEFVAHIADFGLARFSFATTSDINQVQMSSTGIRGTVGYVPPEYGMCGKISAEGDVYSYGIFLLEMFSGKRPTERSISEDSDNNLHDYVRKALPRGVKKIVDPRIVLDQEECVLLVNQSYSRAAMEVCLESIFQVGILCSEEMPRKRIDINVAIKQLHVARDKLLQCTE